MEETMKFSEAMKALEDGKKIRRSQDSDYAYLQLVHGRLVNDHGMLSTLCFDGSVDGWEIVEPKKSFTQREIEDAIDTVFSPYSPSLASIKKQILQLLGF
jgi:hypothetical protein